MSQHVRVPVRTSETQTFVREPGRTAGPSTALGMTKGRLVTFISSRQIGWTERKPQVSTTLSAGSRTKVRVLLVHTHTLTCWAIFSRPFGT
jgi:hypothetical protein